MVNVLVVEKHHLISSAISQLIATDENINIIGIAKTGEDAIAMAKEQLPDVVLLLSTHIPSIGGLEVIRKIKHIDHDIKTLVLIAKTEMLYAQSFMNAGSDGCINSQANEHDLIKAIKSVNAGNPYLSDEIKNFLAHQTASNDTCSPFAVLSKREQQIALLVTQGLSSADIAEKLFLCPKTINTYRYCIFEKLRIKNDVELVLLALQEGLLNSESLQQVTMPAAKNFSGEQVAVN